MYHSTTTGIKSNTIFFNRHFRAHATCHVGSRQCAQVFHKAQDQPLGAFKSTFLRLVILRLLKCVDCRCISCRKRDRRRNDFESNRVIIRLLMWPAALKFKSMLINATMRRFSIYSLISNMPSFFVCIANIGSVSLWRSSSVSDYICTFSVENRGSGSLFRNAT